MFLFRNPLILVFLHGYNRKNFYRSKLQGMIWICVNKSSPLDDLQQLSCISPLPLWLHLWLPKPLLCRTRSPVSLKRATTRWTAALVQCVFWPPWVSSSISPTILPPRTRYLNASTDKAPSRGVSRQSIISSHFILKLKIHHCLLSDSAGDHEHST